MSEERKTPIQELIEEMESLKKHKLYEGSFKAIDDCIHLAWAKLEKEKSIINSIDTILKSNSYLNDSLLFKNHLK